MMPLPPLVDIAAKLGGDVRSGEVLAPGPGHSPQDRSLSIKLDDQASDGFLVHSFSGDDPIACRDYVRGKLGLPPFEPKKNGGGNAWTTVSEYIYQAESGEPYLLVRKYLDQDGRKQYPQYHREADQWVKGKPKGPKVPYRLPQLLGAAPTMPVYVCEGEKDADNLAKLGFIATTTSEGSAAKWAPELTHYFKERNVIILPDADDPGRAHAQKVAKALDKTAASVKVLDLFPNHNDGRDVTDWLEDDCVGTRLVQMAKSAPIWEPTAQPAQVTRTTTDDELINELAALPALEYEKRREQAAEQLGIRVSILDKLVEAARGNISDKNVDALYPHWSVKASAKADGDALMRGIVAAIRRYVVLSDDQAVAIALWIILTWVHEQMTHSPILLVNSPEKDSGKTTLIKVVSFLVRRGLPSVNISGPALFRSIKKWEPTMIVDEADVAFEKNDDLRAVFNSGWTRGDGIIRSNVDTHDPEFFSTFAPKAIGMKGRKLPDTTLSRTIIVTMKPKLASEPVEDFEHLDTEEFADLRSRLMRWACDNSDAVANAKPEIPAGFNNRRRMNWRHLLAIAERIGGEWKGRALNAAKAIEQVHDTFDASIGMQLLAAIKVMLDASGDDRITSKRLLANLIEDETGPWLAFGRSQKPITENAIARLLAPYEIKPKPIKLPGDPVAKRGYLKEWFADVFARHPLPLKTEDQTVTDEHSIDFNSLEQKSTVTERPTVTVVNPPSPLNAKDNHLVTVQKPEIERKGCAQCGGEPDGRERKREIRGQSVWLHDECERFYRESNQ